MRYEDLCDILGSENAFERFRNLKFKHVIASVKNDGDTRLFIRSLDKRTDEAKKEGWWNTFTVSREPLRKGLYICRITDVHRDTNGYPFFFVETVKEIDEEILSSDEMMTFFGVSDIFAEYNPHTNGYNFDRLIAVASILDRTIDTYYGSYIFTEVAKVVRLYLCGAIDSRTIIDCLNTPTDDQVLEKILMEKIEDLIHNKDQYRSVYPLLISKLEKIQYQSQARDIIEDLFWKYDTALSRGRMEKVDGDWFPKIEAYLKFDQERKAANKAAKTAAKKAKKKEKHNG